MDLPRTSTCVSVTSNRRALADLLADARRQHASAIRHVECEGRTTCTGGLRDFTLAQVRGIDLRIRPGLFGRQPRYSRITLEAVSFDSIAVRGAVFDGLSVHGVRLDGPFEGFEACSFSGCTVERLSLHHVLFERCSFADCNLDLRPRDGVTFIDCHFENVVLKGEGEFGIVRSSFRKIDATALEFYGILEAHGDADLALPATPECFFLPRCAIDGPLAPVLSRSRTRSLRPW